MKKLNLDETWRLCMSMWRHVKRRIQSGDKETVESLKASWATKHGYHLDSDCFFCDYVDLRSDPLMDYSAGCKLCPARKIDPEFHCKNLTYHYRLKPIKFYNKLRSLYRLYLKRLKAKKR